MRPLGISVRYMAVSLPKRPCNVTWIEAWTRTSPTFLRSSPRSRWRFYIILFQGGGDGRSYRNTCKIAGGCKATDLRYISHPNSSWIPGVFYTYHYNHAHRLRPEKLLYLELSRSPNGFFKSTSGSRWRFQKRNGRKETVSEVKRLQIYNDYMQRPFPNGKKCPFGCNGTVM